MQKIVGEESEQMTPMSVDRKWNRGQIRNITGRKEQGRKEYCYNNTTLL